MPTYKIVSFVILLLAFGGCTSDRADELYAVNDEAAQRFYVSTLKSVVDNKCISCHTYHLEGSNRYDTYEKLRSNIVQIIARINSQSNIVMPPKEATRLTVVEKDNFKDFLDLLNSDIEVKDTPRVKIVWTAYKYPDFDNRVGVSGTFDELREIVLNENFKTPIDILKNVNTSSVNVGNESERTGNVSSFFKAFTPDIIGNVISYTKDEAVINFRMNTIEEQVTFNVILEENRIILKGKIPNMNSFNWKKAYDVLESVCGEYHQNKLWEDVDISIEILLENEL